jgi:gliding motility-associated-like protein
MRNILFVLSLLLAAFLTPGSASGQVILKTDTITLDCAATDTFFVPLRVRNFTSVGAMQFTLSWDPAFLDYIYTGAVHPLFLAGGASVGFDTITFINQGKLTFNWTRFGGASIPDDTTIFRVAFTRITGPATPVAFVSSPVSIEVTDPIGNEKLYALENGFVIPLDFESPEITCPANLTLQAPTPIPVPNIGLVSQMDNCDLANIGYAITGATNLNAPNDPDASGTIFNFGTSTVTYTATDVGGNSDTCAFTVTLESTGTSDLTIRAGTGTASCNANIAIPITAFNFDSIGSLQFSIAWDSSILRLDSAGLFNPDLQLSASNFGTGFVDSGFVSFAWTTSGLAGNTLPGGDTLFALYFSVLGNVGSNSPIEFDSFPTPPEAFMQPALEIPIVFFNGSVAISDNQPPTITCPANVSVMAAPGLFTADVSGLAPVFADNCSGNLTLTYTRTGATPGSGSGPADGTYSAGTTTVTYRVTDAAGNTATCSFTVMVDAGLVLTLKLDSLAVFCQGAGQQIAFPVTVENFSDVFGLQFSVEWDETVLQFQSVSDEFPGLGLNASNYLGFSTTSDGILRFLGGNPVTGWPAIPNGSTLFTINFILVNPNAGTTVQFIGPFDVVDGTFNSVPLMTQNGNFAVPVDTSGPVFSFCPPDTLANANTNDCVAVLNLPAPIADDACSGLESLLSDQPDNIFEDGVTVVSFTARDNAGNTAVCSFSVTVMGNMPPGFNDCPDPIAVVASDTDCSAAATWTPPVAFGGCGPATVNVVSNFNPGDVFPAGDTLVTYTATDLLGNSALCSFTVTVSDTSAPTIVCPANLTVAPDSGACVYTAAFPMPSVSDNCDDMPSLTGTSIPGNILPIGTTAVQFVATDDDGNSSTCSFEIVVNDQNPPVLDCPDDLTVSADSGICTGVATWNIPSVSDDCSVGTITPTSSDDPGDSFPVGTTAVQYFAADDFGNVGTCAFSITVLETAPPTFAACPPNLIIGLNSSGCDTTLTWAPPTATDLCSGVDTVFSDVQPGTIFTAGLTTITYTAVDTDGNSATCAFTVQILDQTPPFFTGCPGDTLLASAGPCGTVYNFTLPTASDNCDAAPMIISSHQPGIDTFLNGATTVVILAEDMNGNRDTCSFIVTVNATTVPGFANVPAALQYNGCTAIGQWTPPTPQGFCVLDTLIATHMPGDTFQLGVTIVQYTVFDQSGLSATATFTVTVTETEPPVIACPEPVAVNVGGRILSDPGAFLLSADTLGDCSGARLAFNTPTATDNCTTPTISQSGGPASDSALPIGSYTVTYVALDANGNSATCAVQVEVLPLPALNAMISPNPGCPGDFIMITVDSIPGANYTWTGPQVQYPNSPQITIAGLSDNTAGTYTVQATVKGCVTILETLDVTLIHPPIAVNDLGLEVLAGELLDSINVLLNDSLNPVSDFTLEILTDLEDLENIGNGLLSYNAPSGLSGRVSFAYEVCSQTCPDLCAMATVTITVKDSDCTFFPNVFTPNGDDQNDVFKIPCLDSGLYDNSALFVYNQWGDLVYSAEPYSNTPPTVWNGTLNNEQGKDLPDGVYYYIFKSGPNNPPVKGFVQIFR